MSKNERASRVARGWQLSCVFASALWLMAAASPVLAQGQQVTVTEGGQSSYSVPVVVPR